MQLMSCAAVALAVACSCAVAHADGTILFTRPVNSVHNGTLMPTGAGLFVINDTGSGFQQLTPLTANAYYAPSGAYASGAYAASGYWLTKNFSPDGQYIQYFAGKSSDPTQQGPYPGKYYVMDLKNHTSRPLFSDADDNAAPGHGFLAWGPAASNEIAFANSANEVTTSPPCVYLMHTDGSHEHLLWCAPADEKTPQGAVPTLAVDSIRWAGNGKALLAYVSYQPMSLAMPRQKTTTDPVGGTAYEGVYEIDVQTGTAKEVATNAPDPAVGDLSYDGSVVLYQQYGFSGCGNTNPEDSTGVSLCVKNLHTGKVTTLFENNLGQWDLNGAGGWWATYWYSQALLSPDGSNVAVTMENAQGTEADLYVVRSDDTNITQLTVPAANTPAGSEIAWLPAAWSPNGKQLLVNRITAPAANSKNQTTPSEVHVIALSNGRDWRITNGFAVDWLKPSS